MVQMVVEEMERFMKGQTTNAISGPSLLNVLRNALGHKGHSKTFNPLAVPRALKLEDIAFCNRAMTAAAKSGVQDIRDSALQAACSFIEQHFGDGPESINWDKCFTPVFSNDAVKDSFGKWVESKLSQRLDDQAVFDIGDHLFSVETIEKKHENKD
ncbi:hypothetical protein LY76DRAFT_646481 [Colletotrichum caudatum]|nr:hypothetical protein LY76DRAFT_646481 [Colletotrichum caudatum]